MSKTRSTHGSIGTSRTGFTSFEQMGLQYARLPPTIKLCKENCALFFAALNCALNDYSWKQTI